MTEPIKSYDEWGWRSHHGCYEDYVKDMKAAEQREQRASEERIAERVVEKLKGKK